MRHDGDMSRTWSRDPIDEAQLRRALIRPTSPIRKVEAVAELDSTNTALSEAVQTDPLLWPVGSVLLADHQTAGRGRAGRGWEFPHGSAIALSMLVRPPLAPANLGLTPLLAGLGVCRAIASISGLPAQLKWPNDVVIGGGKTELDGWGSLRKVGGILTEGLGDGSVVIGIGVNVSQADDELPVPHAASLRTSGAKMVGRTEIADAIIRSVCDVLAEITDGVAPDHVMTDLVDVMSTLGQEIRVDRIDDSSVTGLAAGLAPSGELILDTDGGLIAVNSGYIHHLRTSS